MKAIVCPKYGPPSVLEYKEVEKPVPKEEEVLVRVMASTVNRTDCAILRAKPFIMRFVTGLFKPKKPILGTAFAGQIEAVGKNERTFKVGDNVFGFNDAGISSHAEYLCISAENALATIPPEITFEEAAASIEGAHYAYNILNKVSISSGQKILVNGATGAIGSATVQLLKQFGVEVTAVGNTKNKELMKALGAVKVIDYTQEDFTKTKEKYNFIFDTVGKSSFSKCKPLLLPGGVYISSELGWLGQNIFFALITPLTARLTRGQGGKKVIFPIPSDIKGSVFYIRKLMEQGQFKTVIDRSYPLAQIAEAYRYVETGEKTGNVVITVQAGD